MSEEAKVSEEEKVEEVEEELTFELEEQKESI